MEKNQAPDILCFMDVNRYLNEYFVFRSKEDPAFDFYAWSQEMGGGLGPQQLQKILRGELRISKIFCDIFAKANKLDLQRHNHLINLARFQENQEV